MMEALNSAIIDIKPVFKKTEDFKVGSILIIKNANTGQQYSVLLTALRENEVLFRILDDSREGIGCGYDVGDSITFQPSAFYSNTWEAYPAKIVQDIDL